MIKKNIFTTAALFIIGCGAITAQTRETLTNGFVNVQDTTRTKVWWFHGQTKTTKEGITADLEAFKRAGVGGVIYYDQVHGTPEKDALEGMSDEWWRMLIYAAKEAKRLGLSFESNISNGYVAGGRWITPEYAMQQLAWREQVVDGGATRLINIPVENPRLNYYGDIAVLAIPYDERLMEKKSFENIPILQRGESANVVIDLGHTISARSVSYSMKARGKAKSSAMSLPCDRSDKYVGYGYAELPMMGELEVSADGKTYREVCKLRPIYRDLDGSRDLTLSFPATEGRYFRLHLHDWWLDGKDESPLQITGASLSARACVDMFEHKNGSYSDYIDNDNTPEYSVDEIVRGENIIDLTDKLHGDTVTWNAPRGKWLVMRFYHQPTGKNSKHGRPGLIGLECDKMNVGAAEKHWNSYPKLVIDSIRSNGADICGILMDSHEQGSQNWTKGFDKYFARHNGYDIKRWLPVMAGFVVDSKTKSDEILRDVRHTIGDKIAEDYFGTLNRLCRESGVTLTAQAIGGGQAIVCDQISVKRYVDKPQGEFWKHHPDGTYDIKECSSAANIYGKPIASGEAFTDAQYNQPLSYIKQLADAAYGLGINEFAICASASQPWLDRIPGNTANGRQYCFNRNNTYWEMSKPFWDYQSRCAYLLRQGKAVHDLALYLGDDMPMKIISNNLPIIPKGFDYDAFTTDALMNRFGVNSGMAMLPDGKSYQAIAVKCDAMITTAAKERLDKLGDAGVKIWRDNGETTFADFANVNGIKPDIIAPQDRMTYFAHRSTGKAEIYMIVNHDDRAIDYVYGLHSTGSSVELWDAVTGKRYRVNAESKGGYTYTRLSLAAHESAFIIISDDNEDDDLPLYEPRQRSATMKMPKGWDIIFDDKRGNVERIHSDSLTDWTNNGNERIKYFSGTATYSTTFRMRAKTDKKYIIHFGTLHDMAHVTVNGKDAGIVWCSPFELDITDHIKNGKNDLKIEVTNSLYNRMIGDTMLPEEERTTWATTPIVTKDTPLMPSGMNEVSIISFDKCN